MTALRSESSQRGVSSRGAVVAAALAEAERRLGRAHDALTAEIARAAPQELPRLQRAAPEPVKHGYGIRPALIPGISPREATDRVTATAYSWPRTEQLLQRFREQLAELERQTREAAGSRGAPERWTGLVDTYLALDRDRRTIDEHVRHNRLWQADIDRRRTMYDTNTELYDLAIARDAARASQATADGEEATRLARRISDLTTRIERGIPPVVPPAYVRTERPSARAWILHVPLVTDIDDREYVEACRRAIEEIWRTEADGNRFEVRLAIRHVTPASLYGASAEPAASSAIDVAAHVARFPPETAVLTTGGTSTYVWGRAIVLGPHDLSTRVLAHEFGHLLGLPDRYFRGYRDLGEDGFEILEVVLDSTDLMSAPGIGAVRRAHFEQVIGPGARQP